MEGMVLCRMWPFLPLWSCMNLQIFTFPSRKPAPVALTHPHVLHDIQREAALQTELLLERLGSWEIKKRRLSTLELRQLFSAVEWGLAEMLHVCLQGTSVQGCSNEHGVRAVTLHCIPCF